MIPIRTPHKVFPAFSIGRIGFPANPQVPHRFRIGIESCQDAEAVLQKSIIKRAMLCPTSRLLQVWHRQRCHILGIFQLLNQIDAVISNLRSAGRTDGGQILSYHNMVHIQSIRKTPSPKYSSAGLCPAVSGNPDMGTAAVSASTRTGLAFHSPLSRL